MSELLDTLHEKSLPTVYRLRPNLFGACFWLMKLGVGLEMLKNALQRGELRAGSLVLESTSGTMGYGLAMAARAMNLKVQLVGDPAISPDFKELLEQLGVRVHLVQEHLEIGGYQIPRLRKIQAFMAENPGALWVRQYDNESNPNSYQRAALRIAQRVGRVDILVAAVGSGGSISGTARKLRELGHPAITFAVDTHGSTLFGQAEQPRVLRGLGNSIVPRNLNYRLIDFVSWVDAADAFCATRSLLADHGLDMGPTTGAAYLTAQFLAREYPDHNVVFLGPDRAERYLSTAYSARWCKENGVFVDRLPESPHYVEHPDEATNRWCIMKWSGRSIDSIGQLTSPRI